MAYEIDTIRMSQEIFYYLLIHHELKEEEEGRLYRAYTEQEEVQNLVKSQGEAADSVIERYGNVIYLIPKEENSILINWRNTRSIIKNGRRLSGGSTRRNPGCRRFFRTAKRRKSWWKNGSWIRWNRN